MPTKLEQICVGHLIGLNISFITAAKLTIGSFSEDDGNGKKSVT